MSYAVNFKKLNTPDKPITTNRFESDDYMQKVSAQDENPSPVSETELGFSARANALKNPQKVHVIEMECQLELKRQREHAQ